MHPASSWTALGQVVAALLSLPSLSLPRLAVPCVLFFFHFAFVFLRSSFERMPPRRSRRAHTRAATIASLTAPMAVPSSTGTVPVSTVPVSTVPVSASTVPSSSGSVAFASAVRGGRRGRPPVVPSAPRDEPTPPSSGDFVPSRDGVLALIRDELRTLQSQFLPENPLQPVPYVVGGSQSGELFTPVGWVWVACCISCIVVAPVSWLIGPSVSCVDTGVSPLYFGSNLPILWLRCLCVGLPMFFMFVCWLAHVFHFLLCSL